METLHKERLEEGIVLEIHQDEDPMSPREWDNLGTMVCWHRQYNLGDRQIKDGEYDSPDAIVAAIVKEEGELAVILPLYLFDHSGLTISTSDEMFRAFDAEGWDWGKVGFIYVSMAKVREEYGGRGNRESSMKPTKAGIDKAAKVLRAEVETYDQYLRLDVYGYVLKNGAGEVLDSCWGFYGFEECLAEAKASAEFYIAEERGPQPVFGVASG